MYLPSTSPSAAALVALVLAAVSSSATTSSPSERSACVRGRGTELASLAACGHQGSLQYCFSVLPEFFSQTDLENCFVNAGCTADESVIEAQWTLRRCDSPESLADLRRRQIGRPPPQDPAEDADAETTAAPGRQQQTTQQQQQQQTTQRQAPQQTTQAPAPQQTTEADPPQQTTESDVVVVVTQTVASSDGQVTAVTTTPLTCIITTTIDTTTCPIQTTGPRAGRETLPCFPTQISFPTCSPGLWCSSDSKGNPTCMKFNNTLDVGGVIVALFFAVVITISIGWITFMCCRDKKEQKKLAAKAEAAAIAAAAKKRPTINVRAVSGQSDRQPLMDPQPQPGYGPAEVDYPPQQQYQAQNYQQENYPQPDPFHDRNRM